MADTNQGHEQFAEELFEGRTSSGLSLPQTFPSWKWVFPSSQERYSTVFQEELDEWFDIYSCKAHFYLLLLLLFLD